MDRFSNNTFTYPMSARPTLDRIKAHSQLHINRTSTTAESQHHILPWYRQTQRPAEQFPLDWNVPLLPELSSSYSAPQSFLQDLNSALPQYTTRGYQNGARTVSPADSPCYKTLSGGFLSPKHLLTEESDISRGCEVYKFLAPVLNPFLPAARNLLTAVEEHLRFPPSYSTANAQSLFILKTCKLRALPFAPVVKNPTHPVSSKINSKADL